MSAEDGQVLLDTFVYKECNSNVELVVGRKFCLYSHKFCTYHNPADPKDKKTWQLHRNCTLSPKSAQAITQQRKLIRPQGMSSIGATFKGAGQPINLHLFTVHFPNSWAAKGYSSVTLGCQSYQDTVHLYSAVEQQIITLRDKSSSFRGGMPSKAAVPLDDVDSSDDSFSSARAYSRTSSMSSATEEQPAGTKPVASIGRLQLPRTSSPESIQLSELGMDANTEQLHHASYSPDPAGLQDYDCSSERWVPYRHTNGVAIYYHSSNGRARSDGQRGEEYMASTIIRGTPQECLDVLINPRSHTTILGPASHIRVLEKEPDSQLLRIQIEATGTARKLCAPREVVVQRTVEHTSEHGIIRVMFGSVERDLQKELGTRSSSSVWAKPVRATVRGGYTISPQAAAVAQPESLVTLILQVDLGGCCGDSSWFRFAADAMGWVDAYVERMLMSVILVKDEVEQSRFMHSPFKMLSSAEAAGEEAGLEALSMPSSPRHKILADLQQHSGKMSTRLARLRTASTMGTPQGAAAALAAEEMAFGNRSGSGRWYSVDSPTAGGAGTPGATLSGVQDLQDGPQVPLARLGTLEQQYWSELHAPGGAAPFKVRGATYLTDRCKVDAGNAEFCLAAVDLVITGTAMHHISRFLPSVRRNRAPFSFVLNLIIPGTPMLSLVLVFVNEHHPDILGQVPPDPSSVDHDWQPFDFLLYRFLHASDEERNSMFKLIPHIADGSWVIKQSVGTTPVLLGNKLTTKYFVTPTYMEVSVDVSSSSAAAYITGMVRGATKSLVIDMAILLEGQATHELPETLIGGMRLHHLDLAAAKKIDTSRELPLLQRTGSKLAGTDPLLRSMTGNHSRKSSNASDVEHMLAAGEVTKARLSTSSKAAAPEPSTMRPAAPAAGSLLPLPNSSSGGSPGPASRTPSGTAHRAMQADDAVIRSVARELDHAASAVTPATAAAGSSAVPARQGSISKAGLPATAAPSPQASSLKLGSNPGSSPLAETSSAPVPGGQSEAKPGKLNKLMKHIRKISGGADADWASREYKQAGHIRKTSVSSLNLGY